jgi:hypothetical protein
VYNHIKVKEGIKSVKGIISSKKESIPANLPFPSLYICIINNADIGAQTTSKNSPINGIEKENIPTASNSILSNKSLLLLFGTLIDYVIL